MNFGGIVVSNDATSDVSRFISVRSHATWDLRREQKGQSSDSKRSACANAHGNRISSCALAGCVQTVAEATPTPMMATAPTANTGLNGLGYSPQPCTPCQTEGLRAYPLPVGTAGCTNSPGPPALPARTRDKSG